MCWSVPAAEPFPPELHGQPIVLVAAVYCGSVEDGEPVVQPLRELGEPLIDLSGPWPWIGLQTASTRCSPRASCCYWKSRALAELTEAAIDEIADFAARRPTPATDIVVWHHGGAMGRVGETDTAYGGRDAAFLVTVEANWNDPAQSDEAIAWGRELWSALERHSTGGLYLNFPGLGEDKEALVRAGYGVNYDRLTAQGQVRPEPVPDESHITPQAERPERRGPHLIGKAASLARRLERAASRGRCRAHERTDPRRGAPAGAGGPHGAGERCSVAVDREGVERGAGVHPGMPRCA